MIDILLNEYGSNSQGVLSLSQLTPGQVKIWIKMEYMNKDPSFFLLLICVESVKTSKGGGEKAQKAREVSSSL